MEAFPTKEPGQTSVQWSERLVLVGPPPSLLCVHDLRFDQQTLVHAGSLQSSEQGQPEAHLSLLRVTPEMVFQ